MIVQLRRGFTLAEIGSVLLIVTVLVTILFPVFTQARAAAEKARCLTQLSELGTALHMYARDHDGRFPPTDHDWKPLVAGGYLDDSDLLLCPEESDRDALARANAGGGCFSSYQYRGGLASDVRPDIPLAGDWTFRHQSGAQVLLVDGRVRWLKYAQWTPITATPRPLPAGFSSRDDNLPTPLQGESWDPAAAPSGEEGE